MEIESERERERESERARERASEQESALLKSSNVKRPTHARIPACAHTERSVSVFCYACCFTMPYYARPSNLVMQKRPEVGVSASSSGQQPCN